jgi:hypothetical protein
MHKVTFGRMERWDPSSGEMDVFLDGARVGAINAEMVEDESSRIVTYVRYKVVGYTVNAGVAEDVFVEIAPGEKPVTALARAKRIAVEALRKAL